MRRMFIDIETIPGQKKPEPSSIKAPANYKDPAKIAAYQQDAVDSEWRGQALESLSGRIACIGVAVDADPAVTFCGPDELLVMHDFDNFMSSHGLYSVRPQIIGFNIRSFDMPWLRHHAYKFRLDRLAEFTPWQRYDKIVLDLREVWTGGDLRAKGTLNEICRFVGLGKKLASGGDVFKMWQADDWDAIAEYNRHEVELIRELWKVMFPYPTC